MKENFSYDTVSEAVNSLVRRGYTDDLGIHADGDCLVCTDKEVRLSPGEFEIDETYRFEGETDPGDEMIVFAISSPTKGIRGILVNAYGAYEDTATSRMVELLKSKTGKTVKPLKRTAQLIPLSRDHHHALLLCWKIRTGLARGVSPDRIRSYATWFYTTHLLPHFELEEKHVFPVLGEEHELVRQALSEHRSLLTLFRDDRGGADSLRKIADELEKHIRFEERILFQKIQAAATSEQLNAIEKMHAGESFSENSSDLFWV